MILIIKKILLAVIITSIFGCGASVYLHFNPSFDPALSPAVLSLASGGVALVAGIVGTSLSYLQNNKTDK